MTTQAHIAGDARSADTARQTKLTRTPLAWAVLFVWGAAIFYLGQKGIFDSPPSEPPATVMIAVLLPSILFLSVYAVSAPMRRWVEGLDLSEIFAMQAWRIIGFAFLVVWGLGELPAFFALPAGIGDMAVGMAAPAVALAVERRTRGWRIGAYGLIAAGMADFIIAFSTGILSRPGAPFDFDGAVPSTLLGMPPLGLFPTFIVPAFLILHVIALIKLRRV